MGGHSNKYPSCTKPWTLAVTFKKHSDMKIASLIALFTFIVSTQSISQKISIANEKMNVFYVGLDNPISIAADGFTTKNLIIKSNN